MSDTVLSVCQSVRTFSIYSIVYMSVFIHSVFLFCQYLFAALYITFMHSSVYACLYDSMYESMSLFARIQTSVPIMCVITYYVCLCVSMYVCQPVAMKQEVGVM